MPVAHNRVRIQGSLPGGEVWSVNPAFTDDGGPLVVDYSVLLGWATNIAALNASGIMPTTLRSLISSAATISSIRCEYRNSAGQLGQAAEFTLNTPVAGTGTPTKPFQTSLVSSLLTGRPGRSYRGRLYWPALAAAISTSTLRVTNPSIAGAAAASAEFLTQIAGAVPAPFATRLVVVSDKLSVATPVTSVVVGDVLDVQRRRRDTLQEASATQAYPYVAP